MCHSSVVRSVCAILTWFRAHESRRSWSKAQLDVCGGSVAVCDMATEVDLIRCEVSSRLKFALQKSVLFGVQLSELKRIFVP